MNIFKTIDQLSYKKVLSLSLLISLILTIPIAVITVSQPTRVPTKAEPETTPLPTPKPAWGPPPTETTEISKIWPFLGKEGDVIWITGKNLGQNPKERKVSFNGKLAKEKDILKWTQNAIELKIPVNAQSGNISLEIFNKQTAFNIPFTIYQYSTQTKIIKSNNTLTVQNPFGAKKIKVFFENGKTHEQELKNNTLVLPSTNNIVSIVLLNEKEEIIPFYVKPEEFDF